MATPLHDLQRLVASRNPVAGRVVATTDGMVRVATVHGVMEVSSDDGLQVGQRVTVRDSKALKIQGQQGASVHFV